VKRKAENRALHSALRLPESVPIGKIQPDKTATGVKRPGHRAGVFPPLAAASEDYLLFRVSSLDCERSGWDRTRDTSRNRHDFDGPR